MRIAAAVLAVALVSAGCNEPRYQYKTEKEWLSELRADEARRRAWAADALGAMKAESDETRHALLQALNDESASVRVNVAKSLAHLSEGRKHRATILQMLWRVASDSLSDAQLIAVEALALQEYRDDRSLPLLIAALKDNSAAMRGAAAATLAQFRSRAKAAESALQEALSDTNETVRDEARHALAAITGRDAH